MGDSESAATLALKVSYRQNTILPSMITLKPPASRGHYAWFILLIPAAVVLLRRVQTEASQPLPDVESTHPCNRPCLSHTCGKMKELRLTCADSSHLGCSCAGCCSEPPSAPLPPPALPPVPMLPAPCAARTVHTVVAGIFEEADGEEEGETLALLVNNPFTSHFFNMTCLRDGGTGDPCDIHVAEAYADEVFKGLRMEYLVSLVLSVAALFSLSQLGGIPRPSNDSSGDDAETSIRGTTFFLAWMVTQVLQYVTIFFSLLMHVAAFLSVRSRLKPCLILDMQSSPIIDAFAIFR